MMNKFGRKGIEILMRVKMVEDKSMMLEAREGGSR